jgi:sulfonate transport system substrate-binding protein
MRDHYRTPGNERIEQNRTKSFYRRNGRNHGRHRLAVLGQIPARSVQDRLSEGSEYAGPAEGAPAGPQLLEGLNVGAIDFGYVGEAPPVFAQAAGADFVYTAYELPTPHAEGVVVTQDSPINSVADLKGKKVAFNKGSDVHWFIVALLRKHGLDFTDIHPVYLAPADARAALEQHAVDAWAIWDPFLAAVQGQSKARLIADAEGVASHHQFFLSQREFAEKRKDVIAIALEEVGKEGQWVKGNVSAAAAQLAPIQGLDAGIIEAGLRHYAHAYKPIDDAVLAEQQKIADTFFELKLIPRKIVTKQAVLS